MDRSEIKVWVLLTLYGGVGLAIFTTGLFAFNDQHYPLGVAFTVAGLGVTADAGRRALGHGFTVPNSVLAVMLALTWMFLGYDIYDRHYLPAVEAPDARLFPLAKGSTFFDAIPLNDESVMVWCFPYEAHSCSIALQFRARLAGRVGTILNWNGFVTGLSPLPADFKGINIATRSDQDRPVGARALYSELRELQVPCEFKADGRLGANDFAVWIGGKP